jgi:putative glutamine amidotransferase
MSARPASPVVGITLRPQTGADDRPARLVQNRAYFDALEAAGAVPLGIPLLGDPDRLRALYERCDAICLPGGPDVEPHRYGEEPRADVTLHTAPELDDTETLLVRWLVAEDRPTLAICRGMQMLNVALGGSLWQDVQVQQASPHSHEQRSSRTLLAHDVHVEPGSLLHRVVGVDTLAVNSLHHQAVRRVGEGLHVSGRADDGIVEALELPDRRFLLAVQWHPEELAGEQEWARRLFGALVSAAR